MAQATNNAVPASVSVPTTLASALRSQATADRKHDTTTTTVTSWKDTVAYSWIGKTFNQPRFDACRAIYVDQYCAGLPQVSAADVKAQKGTQAEADAWDEAKRDARRNFGEGTNRAMRSAGLSRPTKNRGGGKTATPATPATVESTAVLPLAFVAKLGEAFKAAEAFQVHFGAKLPKAGKDAAGNVAALIGECIKMLEPSPTGAGTPPEGTPQNPGSK